MALIIQTNDGLNNANSYASVAELTTYADTRGIVLKGNPEQLLLKAIDVVDAKQYKSDKTNLSQQTEFPRLGVGIPASIKKAQILLAVAADTNDLLSATTEQVAKREKVSEIEVEYFEGNGTHSKLLMLVDELLKPYLSGGIALNFRVYRG